MFHHFHGLGHLPAQGSITGLDFRNMLSWLSSRYSLIGAHEYREKFKNGSLSDSDICLSFDDALKCQFDIAAPILAEFKIDAFFFVYSSAFSKNPDPLEIYRLFRTSNYENVDEFYDEFFGIVEAVDAAEFKRCATNYNALDYLSGRPYYSESDKWFRYLRDQYLGQKKYKQVMESMMQAKSFDVSKAREQLWMTEEDLICIDKQGHVIGMHSNSHPTQMSKLVKSVQLEEYRSNQRHLQSILKKTVDVMSHPCGDYNEDTIKVLFELGVCMGFRANMEIPFGASPLELPRENHANIYREMRA